MKSAQIRYARRGAHFILTLVLAFLTGPFFIIVAASFSAGETLAFPPQGFSLRWIAKVFTVESFQQSFVTSMILAIGGTLSALVCIAGLFSRSLRNVEQVTPAS